MKIIILCLLFTAVAQAYLSKDWTTKEMSCYRFCMVERGYDGYGLSNNKPYTCTCKVIKLNRKVCRIIGDDEYLQKFDSFKTHLIKNKIIPLFKRYQKFYPSSPVFDTSSVQYTPSVHTRNLIVKNI